MAIQYIGARYVPKFYQNPNTGDMTWKSGNGYEALTVVTYQGDTYTSKKPVPSSVGNPAANSDFWAKTGNFNAALQALQNEVDNIENVEIPDINNRLNSLLERNVIFVGDSYSVGSASTIHYPEVVASSMGLDNSHYHVLGHSGWGFANSDFYNLISSYAGDRDAITDIVVLGGLNDAAKLDDTLTDGQLMNLIETFVNYCKSEFTNAKIWIGVLGWSKSISNASSSVRHYNRMEKCYARGTQWGAIYLDGFMPIAHDYNILSNDETHPNDNGQLRIGRALASKLMGGDMRSNTTQLDITLTSSQSTSQLPSVCFQNADNENVYLFLLGTIEFTSAISFSLHQQRNILTMSDGYINSGNLGSFMPVLVEVTDDNNNTTWEEGRLTFSGKNIAISFVSFTGSVRKIKFSATTLTINIYTA